MREQVLYDLTWGRAERANAEIRSNYRNCGSDSKTDTFRQKNVGLKSG